MPEAVLKAAAGLKERVRPTDEENSFCAFNRSFNSSLFPKTYKKKKFNLSLLVLSLIMKIPKILGAIGSFDRIHLSNLPWKGPVAPLTVGMKDEKYIVNPIHF